MRDIKVRYGKKINSKVGDGHKNGEIGIAVGELRVPFKASPAGYYVRFTSSKLIVFIAPSRFEFITDEFSPATIDGLEEEYLNTLIDQNLISLYE